MFRPRVPIIATTANEKAQRQMQLLWGVVPFLMKQETSPDLLFYKSSAMAKAKGIVKTGDTVVITAGFPLAVTGKTNLMKVDEIE